MFKENKAFIQKYIIVLLGILILGFIYVNQHYIQNSFIELFSILKPFIIGFFIAYIFNSIIVFFCEKFKWKRSFSITFVYLIFAFFIVLLFTLVIPIILKNISEILNEFPMYMNNAKTFVEKFDINLLQEVKKYTMKDFNSNFFKVSKFMNYVFNNFFVLLKGVSSTFATMIFSLIVSIYMLIEKDKLISIARRVILKIFKAQKGAKVISFIKNSNEIFSKFLTGLIVDALIVATICFIGLVIFRVKYALLLSVIIGFTNVIPYLGPFLGGIPAVLVTLLYSPTKALIVIIFILVLQQIDGNFISPKIMGNYIGLSPFWILLAIAIGGGFFGMVGMILAVPTAAIIKIVFCEIMEL